MMDKSAIDELRKKLPDEGQSLLRTSTAEERRRSVTSEIEIRAAWSVDELFDAWMQGSLWQVIDAMTAALSEFSAFVVTSVGDTPINNQFSSMTLARGIPAGQRSGGVFSRKSSVVMYVLTRGRHDSNINPDELYLLIRCVSAQKPHWPTDWENWKRLADVSAKCQELAAPVDGVYPEEFPAEFESEMLNAIDACIEDVHAMTLLQMATEGRPKTPAGKAGGDPTEDDIAACTSVILAHMRSNRGVVPLKTAIATAAGGARQRMLRAAEIALQRFADSQNLSEPE